MNLPLYRRILAGESASFPLAPRALWKLDGPDATRYLNGQVTNDVAHLPDGRAFYAAVCTAKGRMEGDVVIARHGGAFYLDADAALREGLGARLDKFLIADDAVFEDIADTWSVVHSFGATPPPAPPAGFVIAHARYGLPGHDAWTPSTSPEPAEPVADAALVETLRLEHGLPRWGAELTPTTLPPEAGPAMLAAISYTKGCYVGQETIARLKSVGHVNRTLVFLRSTSREAPAPGARLLHEGREVGVVTSSGFSPRLEGGMALGYVQRALAVDGTTLETGELDLTVGPSLLREVAA